MERDGTEISGLNDKKEGKKEINWIDVPRSIILEDPPNRNNNNYTKNLAIDENFSELDESQIEKLLIPPLDHQKKLIKAMIDVENKQTINIRTNSSGFYAQSRACILSDKPGSGKSYSIIALFILNRKLPVAPIFMEDNLDAGNNKQISIHSRTINNVVCTPKTVLPVNLVFVSKNVMEQWVEYISRFSEGLGIVIIDKFNSAKKIIEDFAKNKKYFANTDIILIKNDKVNSQKGKIDHPALKDKSMANKSMVEIFSDLINGSNLIVNRVVLDDFDSLMIPSQTKIIPAKFTWFVSATKGKYRHTNEKNVYNNILENTVLSTYFNLNTNPEFLLKSIKFCDVRVRQYRVIDSHSRVRNGIVQFNDGFSELVNSDSVAEMGKRLDIKGDHATIYDIFEKMYENEFKTYKKFKLLSQKLAKISDYYEDNLSSKPKIKQSPEVISYLKKLISDGSYDELRLKWTDFSNETLEKYIETCIETTEKNLRQKSVAIERVISNFREGTCPITFEDLKDGEIGILKCCGIVLSVEGLRTVRNSLCPACRAPMSEDNTIIIDFANKDIILDEEMQLDDIEEEKSEQKTNLTSNELDVDDLIGMMTGSITTEIPYNSEEISELVSTKANSVLKLITQDNPNLSEVSNYYKNFGGGDFARLDQRKFIIFASSPMAIRNLVYEDPYNKKGDRFQKYNISYAEVKGMQNKITEKIKRFRLPNNQSASIKVLFITSRSQAFAGLDLQCTTDIIFLNKINDTNIEKQMIGRALRLGRANKLDIHYLMYNNEIFDLQDISGYF